MSENENEVASIFFQDGQDGRSSDPSVLVLVPSSTRDSRLHDFRCLLLHAPTHQNAFLHVDYLISAYSLNTQTATLQPDNEPSAYCQHSVLHPEQPRLPHYLVQRQRRASSTRRAASILDVHRLPSISHSKRITLDRYDSKHTRLWPTPLTPLYLDLIKS